MSGDAFERLEAHWQSLSPKAQAKEAAKGKAYEGAVFDLVRQGDALGLYASVKADPSLLNKQDARGMTPLHYAGIDRSGTLADVMLSQPNKAPWTRDKAGRLPLDMAQITKRKTIAAKIERATYPHLFEQEKDGPLKPEQIARFADTYQELGRPDTRPPYAQSFQPRAMMPRLKGKERDERER